MSEKCFAASLKRGRNLKCIRRFYVVFGAKCCGTLGYGRRDLLQFKVLALGQDTPVLCGELGISCSDWKDEDLCQCDDGGISKEVADVDLLEYLAHRIDIRRSTSNKVYEWRGVDR